MGIAIEKLSEGRGDPPSIDDYVTVHYVMKTMSGMTVANSRDRNSEMGGEPLRFRLGCGSVIKGLDQGILKLNVGDHARLILSPDLCYGSKGFYPLIPANSGLIVQVELLDAESSQAGSSLTIAGSPQAKKGHEHHF
mmetsp:Transcript_21788/g.34966  ORF Transcript_21788/g.34966 Transcript_21788/m.34966 type:complete len:137 (+) Transcript_21788:31-441(+)|eukprot:CAMPEP_0179447494 /NCGR_PEP_ID=MMETSP0799-20121207/31326_1 /TAXON_ID=46947 /ORGANISM="Geminigera cryophila, Strain CCMP2564" /LENGTH=136 /DNA_ID=CAMNT_0021238365 /DNA_START=31 /DNA_END=441 /DNA_ORIENTATION=+